MVDRLKFHWRDVISIVTLLLILGSMVMISYGVRQVNNHVDCVAKFFTTRNRTNKSISDTQCGKQFQIKK
jgi:hypothetical protein